MYLKTALIILGGGSVTPQKMHTLGLENCQKGQRTGDLKAALCRAWDITQRFNAEKVSASTHKKLQNLCFCCFSLLWFQMQVKPLPARRDNTTASRKEPDLSEPPQIWEVRARGQCCFLHIKDGQLQPLFCWGAAPFCSASAPRQPRAPHYFPAAPGCSHQAKRLQLFALNGVKHVTQAEELEGLTTALLFVQH